MGWHGKQSTPEVTGCTTGEMRITDLSALGKSCTEWKVPFGFLIPRMGVLCGELINRRQALRRYVVRGFMNYQVAKAKGCWC